MSTKVDTVTLNGVDVDIRFSVSGEEFYAEFQGQNYSAPSYSALKAKLQRATKKATVTVSVPFSTIDGNGALKNGTATGLHSANGNVLVTWHTKRGDQKEQLSSYGFGSGGLKCHRLTPDEYTEFCGLSADVVNARRAMDTWQAKHTIDLKARVKLALDEATKVDD